MEFLDVGKCTKLSDVKIRDRRKASIGICVIAVAGLALTACSNTSHDDQRPTGAASQSNAAAPAPAPSVVGPMADPSVSPQLAQADKTFTTMKQTEYSHHDVENVATGYYAWDCVGFTDWNLNQASPATWTAMHDSLHIRPHYVPSPQAWYDYFESPASAGTWQSVTNISALQPGDYLLFSPNPATRFVGHSAIAAGPPLLLSDGSYALRVFDSTGTAHGPQDSRLTDPRAINHSGLGNGTMRLFVDSSGNVTSAAWSVDAGGPTMEGVNVAIAAVK